MNPGRISPGAWLMVVLVYIWDIIMTGHMEVLQLAAQYHCKKHRVESEDTKRRSRDMINEKKDKFADDMMVLRFSLVGSLGTASIR